MGNKRSKISVSVLEKYTRKELNQKVDTLTRLLRNYERWGCVVETDGVYTITYEGEEWHYFDLLEGLRLLPERQRQAVELVCLQDKTEKEAAEIMGFQNWSSQVNQYRRAGIKKMLAYQETRRGTVDV